MRGSKDGSKNFIFMSLIGTCGHSIIEHNICITIIIIIISCRSIHMTSSTLKERCSYEQLLLQYHVHCYLSTSYLLTPPHSFAMNLAHTYPPKEHSWKSMTYRKLRSLPLNMSWLMKLWRERIQSHCLTTHFGITCLSTAKWSFFFFFKR
jgi:hypothetical protein